MAEWTVDKKDVKSTVDGDYMLYRNRPSCERTTSSATGIFPIPTSSR